MELRFLSEKPCGYVLRVGVGVCGQEGRRSWIGIWIGIFVYWGISIVFVWIRVARAGVFLFVRVTGVSCVWLKSIIIVVVHFYVLLAVYRKFYWEVL
jgi:hypothetical protein